MYFQKNFRLLTYGSDMNGINSKPVTASEWGEIPSLFEYITEIMQKTHRTELSAPQLGCFKQVVVVKDFDESFTCLVNPEITRIYGREVIGRESCLSIPPKTNGCPVPRAEIIDVEYFSIENQNDQVKRTFNGGMARIVQHGIDHLGGTFFIDRISERKQKEVLKRFDYWKAMRKAQIRRVEEGQNVDTGLVAAGSGQSRLS